MMFLCHPCRVVHVKMDDQSVRFSHLPLMRIMFLSNSAIVGVGYDFNPMLFSKDGSNFWYDVCFP